MAADATATAAAALAVPLVPVGPGPAATAATAQSAQPAAAGPGPSGHGSGTFIVAGPGAAGAAVAGAGMNGAKVFTTGWSTRWHDCCDDGETCAVSTFCPCVQAGRNFATVAASGAETTYGVPPQTVIENNRPCFYLGCIGHVLFAACAGVLGCASVTHSDTHQRSVGSSDSLVSRGVRPADRPAGRCLIDAVQRYHSDSPFVASLLCCACAVSSVVSLAARFDRSTTFRPATAPTVRATTSCTAAAIPVRWPRSGVNCASAPASRCAYPSRAASSSYREWHRRGCICRSPCRPRSWFTVSRSWPSRCTTSSSSRMPSTARRSRIHRSTCRASHPRRTHQYRSKKERRMRP